MNMNRSELDQKIGSLLEAWINRPTGEANCRFCEEPLEEEKPANKRYCSDDCEKALRKVMEARIAIGERDLQQRGYD